jgi:hypothetical protein
MRHVSVHKKFLTFFTLAVVVLIASATATEAQGRRGHRRVVVVGGYYPYASPFWFGDPWYGYHYPWRPYGLYGPYGYYGFPEASVRLEVTPRDAEVYVDGYYAGTVDDFDGAFQRLHVEPGEHEIEVYREGFRPFRQKVYLTSDHTFRVRQALQPLAQGEQPEPRPQPLNPPPQGAQPSPGAPMPRGRRPMPPPPPGSDPRAGQPQAPRGGQAPSEYGTVAIRVQPPDAEISIDGEGWRGPGGQDRLVIDLAEGSHTVEIRKPGYRTYVTQVEVRRGETTPLNVSLRNEQ